VENRRISSRWIASALGSRGPFVSGELLLVKKSDSLDLKENRVIYSVSGGLGERNTERNLRSSAEVVCKPTLEWEA
jgi:hypothetical protein